MNVKSFLWLTAFAVMLSTTAHAQSGSAIRSATFSGPEGLGVLPVTNNTMASSALSNLQLDPAGSFASDGCSSPGCTDPGCTGISCTSPAGCTGCGDIGCSGGCCPPMGCPNPCRSCAPCGWMHNISVYGEFLYWRARNAEVPYAVVQNSNLPPPAVPIQVSPIAMVDPDFEPSYRVGFGFSLGTCNSVGVQYTSFESNTTDTITLGPAGVGIIGLVLHPTTLNTSSNVTVANAFQSITFDMIDADFRELISSGPSHRINYLIGASYTNLEQQFGARNINNGTETVFTDIDFDGAGFRLGLEMERFSRNRGMITYAKAITTVLAGEFDAFYAQGSDFDASIVNTGWQAGRVMPILEVEAGFGWQFHDGAYRLTAGYNFNAWFNTVKTDEWIRAVQTNNFNDLGSTMTFDGLVARFESRF